MFLKTFSSLTIYLMIYESDDTTFDNTCGKYNKKL